MEIIVYLGAGKISHPYNGCHFHITKASSGHLNIKYDVIAWVSTQPYNISSMKYLQQLSLVPCRKNSSTKIVSKVYSPLV